MNSEKKVDLVRHRTRCQICVHPDVQEINEDFKNWKGPAEIVEEYQLGDRTKLFRHARALGLYEKRDRNVRFALGKLIEHAGTVVPNAQAVVAAAVALSKVNSRGQYVERVESVNLNKLFDLMSQQELERYASFGELPAFFTQAVGTDADAVLKSDD